MDLDLSVAMFDSNKNFCNLVFFQNLSANGIFHSGDDRVGDTDGDDGLDNEIISVNLSRLDRDIEQLVFVLNSYNLVDFNNIPFASIRLYEGTPKQVNKVFASYNIVNDYNFARKVAMILGKLYKKNGEWKFSAIGEPTEDRNLSDLISKSVVKFL